MQHIGGVGELLEMSVGDCGGYAFTDGHGVLRAMLDLQTGQFVNEKVFKTNEVGGDLALVINGRICPEGLLAISAMNAATLETVDASVARHSQVTLSSEPPVTVRFI